MMTECVPFLKVRDVEETLKWYEEIGFICSATNLIWEPGGELNWARIEWEGAAFMIGPDERSVSTERRDSSLWFNVDQVDSIIDTLKRNEIQMEMEPETFYGRRVVSFKDINGFTVSFSCELKKITTKSTHL